MDKKTIDDLMEDIRHSDQMLNDLVVARYEESMLIGEEYKLKKIDEIIETYTTNFAEFSKKFNEKYECYKIVCEEYGSYLSLVINKPFNRFVKDIWGGGLISWFIGNIFMAISREGYSAMPENGKGDSYANRHTRIIINNVNSSEVRNLIKTYIENEENRTKTCS